MWAGENLTILGSEGYFEHVTDGGQIVTGSGTWANKKQEISAALASIGLSYTDDQVVVDMMGYTRGDIIRDWGEFERIQ